MLNIRLEKWTITYNTAKTNRSKYINEFTNTNNIAVMLNVHILDEGINIPECDCVFITKPNDNIINVVQRMSRANRVSLNKTHCNIYMWATQNKANKVMDYISDKIEDLIENKVKCFDCVKLINKHYQYDALNRDNCEENICKRVGNVDTKMLCNLTEDFYVYIQAHSTLPKEFIKDFFGLNSSMDIYNFCIDLELIAKWMGSRKCDLKETVINSYKKNVDYKITKNVSNGKVGKPGETIMLTPKCFKIMAMQTRSKKGVQVREYYYELEQVVDQYKEYIIQGLQEKIKKLENNQKPKINPQKGVIYIIETDDGIGHYKLGKTSNLKKRLATYSSSKKDDIIPIYVYETDNIDAVEQCVKRYAKEYQYRKYKEVYKTDINMLKDLINDCGEFDEKTSLKMKHRSQHQDGGNYYIAMYRE